MNRQIIKICIGILCFGIFLLSSNVFAQEKNKKEYDIAAIVWPSYHPDPRAKIFWPDGIGEWQTVISNKPKFEGHEQPRYPLWGYVNQADRYVAEMEIEAATEYLDRRSIKSQDVTPDVSTRDVYRGAFPAAYVPQDHAAGNAHFGGVFARRGSGCHFFHRSV